MAQETAVEAKVGLQALQLLGEIAHTPSAQWIRKPDDFSHDGPDVGNYGSLFRSFEAMVMSSGEPRLTRLMNVSELDIDPSGITTLKNRYSILQTIDGKMIQVEVSSAPACSESSIAKREWKRLFREVPAAWETE